MQPHGGTKESVSFAVVTTKLHFGTTGNTCCAENHGFVLNATCCVIVRWCMSTNV